MSGEIRSARIARGAPKPLAVPDGAQGGWPWQSPRRRRWRAVARLRAARAWPRISVIVPSLNQGAYLETALRSILLQGYPDLELIVVDGGSRDHSREILEHYNSCLAWWCSEVDRGQAHAINKGLRKASGSVLGWLNSDDLLLPASLWHIGRAFARPAGAGRSTPDAIAGLRREVREDGSLAACWVRDRPQPQHLRRYCCLAQETVYFHRRVYRRLGGLDESMGFALDYEYWLRMLAYGFRFTLLPAYLGGCRDHPRTKRATATRQRARDLRVLHRRHHLGRNEEEAMMRGGTDWALRMALLEDFSRSALAPFPHLALACQRLLDRPSVARRALSLYRRYRFHRPPDSPGNGRLRAWALALGGELIARRRLDRRWSRLRPASAIQRRRLAVEEVARASDVCQEPNDTLALGRGWSWFEQRHDLVWRWAQSDAELLVLRPSGRRRHLRLDLETGPGLAWQPFELVVRDEAGRNLNCQPIDRRATVVVDLPLAAGPHVRRFHLHTGGTQQPASRHDPRVLHFRATFVGWEDAQPLLDLPQALGETVQVMPSSAVAGDILPAVELAMARKPPRDGLMLGDGWSAADRDARGPWRQIRGSGEIVVTRASGRCRRLLVEADLPGPQRPSAAASGAASFRAATLRLIDAAGRLDARLLPTPARLTSEPLIYPLVLTRGHHIRLRLCPSPAATLVRIRAIRWCSER